MPKSGRPEKTPHRRVSDLSNPFSPQQLQSGSQLQSASQLQTSSQLPTSSQPMISSQPIKAGELNAGDTQVVLPQKDRIDYQRKLAELLFQSPGTWRNRQDLQHRIGASILDSSRIMDGRNFQKIATQDLERMAEAYDRLFFNGYCLPLARSYGLSFRLSSRMTRAGGKTTRTIYRRTLTRPERTHYEIALSTSLLFQSFRRPNDKIRVCGYDCQDRLSAMQRIVEHEMVHLCEMLAWIHSDCSASRFQSIAGNMFGHTEHRHELITQQERAAKEFNIRSGTKVAFTFEGKLMHGIVNRITRRATILVEDPRGERYTNGKHYLKFYVPVHQLRPIHPSN